MLFNIHPRKGVSYGHTVVVVILVGKISEIPGILEKSTSHIHYNVRTTRDYRAKIKLLMLYTNVVFVRWPT